MKRLDDNNLRPSPSQNSTWSRTYWPNRTLNHSLGLWRRVAIRRIVSIEICANCNQKAICTPCSDETSGHSCSFDFEWIWTHRTNIPHRRRRYHCKREPLKIKHFLINFFPERILNLTKRHTSADVFTAILYGRISIDVRKHAQTETTSIIGARIRVAINEHVSGRCVKYFSNAIVHLVIDNWAPV